jgi:hypothetical protein
MDGDSKGPQVDVCGADPFSTGSPGQPGTKGLICTE